MSNAQPSQEHESGHRKERATPRSHPGIRVGCLELMRATEQTAALLQSAEGVDLSKMTMNRLAICSIGGFLLGSVFSVKIAAVDENSCKGDGLATWAGMGLIQLPKKIATAGNGQASRSQHTLAGSQFIPVIGAGRAALNKQTQGTSEVFTGPPRVLTPVEIEAREAEHRADPFGLDLCVTPIDGKRALALGRAAGTSVALAAGRPGCFSCPEADYPQLGNLLRRDQDYLVLLLRKSPLADALTTNVPLLGWTDGSKSAKPKDELCRLATALIEQFVQSAHAPGERPTFGVLDEHGLGVFKGSLRHLAALKSYVGSSIALGVGAMRSSSGLDGAIAIVEHVHACQLAVAAKATGGALLAIAIDIESNESGVPTRVSAKAPLALTHNAFVNGDDCILVCSAVSPHLVFSGVRSYGESLRRVETVGISARTSSVRFLRHWIHMEKSLMCVCDPTTAPRADRRGEARVAWRWADEAERLFRSAVEHEFPEPSGRGTQSLSSHGQSEARQPAPEINTRPISRPSADV